MIVYNKQKTFADIGKEIRRGILMSLQLEKEMQQIFKESYLEHLYQFLSEDEEYLLLKEKINFAKNEVSEFPTETNKKQLKKMRLQLSEYVHMNIFEMGFSEGLNYSQSCLREYLT